MIRRPPRSTQSRSSAASDVYKRQTKTLYEWINCGQENVAGAWFTDKDWADNVKSRLSDWNDSCNKRIQTAQKQLKDALKEYYGFEDADLK